VLVGLRKYKEVAKEYGIGINRVSLLVNKAVKKAKYIEELVNQRDLKDNRRD